MSVAGIFSSSLMNYLAPSVQSKTQAAQSSTQQFMQEFQQLGQALQSGNLSSAQADSQSLQGQIGTQAQSTSSQSGGPFAQEFNQLSQDLQSGNLSAAKQDYATIQQTSQKETADGHHHHHHGGGGENAISQSLDQIGQALQAGNLSAAQQAYSSLQQEFPQLAQTSGMSPSSSNSLAISI
jgi:soluble cytochrome b562